MIGLSPVVVVLLSTTYSRFISVVRRACASSRNPLPACGSPDARRRRESPHRARTNHVRHIQLVLRIGIIAEGSLRCRVSRVAVHGVVLKNFAFGIGGLRLLPLRGQSRRGDRRAQEINPCPPDDFLSASMPREMPQKYRPVVVSRRDRTTRCDRSGSYRSSSVPCVIGSDAALVVRVLRIAVHLHRPVSIALDQKRNGAGGKGKSRCKVHRLAQNQIFGRLHIRIDRLIGLLGATGESGQRHRRAHHLQKAAPRHRIDPLRGLLGKLLTHRRLELRRPGQFIDRPPVSLPVCPASFARTSQRQRQFLRLPCPFASVFPECSLRPSQARDFSSVAYLAA